MKRWFSGSQTRSEGLPLESSGPLQSEVFTSLALNVLYYQLRPERKYHILDLGPAVAANVNFFSQASSKIYIEDLYRTLTSFDFFSPEDGFTYQAVFEYLLPYSKNTRFDIVLSWDLFNYLEREEFYYLMQHLQQFCHVETTLFALISTLKHIPEKPLTFKIIDEQQLLYQNNSSVLRACPQYQQTDLNQMLPTFRVANSFLLRNGFKEYLFICE